MLREVCRYSRAPVDGGFSSHSLMLSMEGVSIRGVFERLFTLDFSKSLKEEISKNLAAYSRRVSLSLTKYT